MSLTLPQTRTPFTAPLPPAAVAWTALDAAEADRCAWRAVCDWPRAAGFDPIEQGIDYALLLRAPLRHCVGRAVRRLRNPSEGAWEAARRAKRAPRAAASDRWPASARRMWRMCQRLWRFDAPRLPTPQEPAGRTIFLTWPHARWNRTQQAVSQAGWPLQTAGARLGQLPREVQAADAAFARRLIVQLQRGLQTLGLALPADDLAELAEQAALSHACVRLAHHHLAAANAGLLVVYSDNDPPNMEYVLAARQLGIPSLMIQHGLDCEPWVLDDAYASHLALWGDARRRRYHQHSAQQPRSMTVTGNPEYDLLAAPADVSDGKGDWLWATRPHTSDKCYLPSRSTAEGLRIFEALCAALADHPETRLIVKPHPFDDADLYAEQIAARGLTTRIEISQRPLSELLPAAGVVISEDSSAGLDAMFYGKPLVHAHFAASAPSMPFAAYAAALSGRNAESLRESLAHAARLSGAERQAMAAGQRAFIEDFAGPRDARAAERLAELVARLTHEAGAGGL